MDKGFKRFIVRFYKTDSGNEPVRKWLKGLEPADRKTIGGDLQTLEFGWPTVCHYVALSVPIRVFGNYGVN